MKCLSFFLILFVFLREWGGVGVGRELSQRRGRVFRNGSRTGPFTLSRSTQKNTTVSWCWWIQNSVWHSLIPSPEREREEETECGLKETWLYINIDLKKSPPPPQLAWLHLILLRNTVIPPLETRGLGTGVVAKVERTLGKKKGKLRPSTTHNLSRQRPATQ